MADAEREEKLAAISGLAGNFSASLSPETAKMWLFLLKDYSAGETQAAALALIRKHGTETVPYRTMPPFALMQKELDLITGALRGEESLKLQARAEWGKLLSAIEESGSWREPDLNRTTAYCVRCLGGWAQVCRWKMEDICWREREFLSLWEESAGREEMLEAGSEAVKALEGNDGLAALRMQAFGRREHGALPAPKAVHGKA